MAPTDSVARPSNPGLVSIVLPTYNARQYVQQALESCLNQTYRDVEVIVVDGGSTDDTLPMVAGYQHSALRLVHQAHNTGRFPGALNLGFANARGEYFTWTQADDYYAPDAIETMVSHLGGKPDVGLIYAGFWWIDAAGRVLRPSDEGAPEALLWTNPVGHCFLYRRTVADRVGEYDAGAFSMAPDTHYWMRVYRHFKMTPIDGRYYYHREHGDTLSSRDYGIYRANRESVRARRDILGLDWFEYQRQIAAVSIEEGFAARARGDFRHVRRCLVEGVLRHPLWLRNRGVVSIGIESIIGSRPLRAYRVRREHTTSRDQ